MRGENNRKQEKFPHIRNAVAVFSCSSSHFTYHILVSVGGGVKYMRECNLLCMLSKVHKLKEVNTNRAKERKRERRYSKWERVRSLYYIENI